MDSATEDHRELVHNRLFHRKTGRSPCFSCVCFIALHSLLFRLNFQCHNLSVFDESFSEMMEFLVLFCSSVLRINDKKLEYYDRIFERETL